MTVDPEIPVPPKGYGGIERIVNTLAKCHHEKGNEVILLANPESTCKYTTRNIGWRFLKSTSIMGSILNAIQLLKTVIQYRPDIIHSFSRLLYLYPVFIFSRTKVVQTYQRQISEKSTSFAEFFARKRLKFTACGAHIFSNLKNKSQFEAIHNFTDTSYFLPSEESQEEEYLFFLGRIEEIKGTYEAIQVAKAAGEKLIIAGNINTEHQHYFDTKVKPYFNEQIKYVGVVNDEQKKALFQKAKAFIFPIKWQEPFGIVMAEALSCGVPVLGFNIGSVPEVITQGENGFISTTIEQMTKDVFKIDSIDKRKVRESAVSRFSESVIFEKYNSLFQSFYL